jgi:D-lyxose ketol-isomerase
MEENKGIEIKSDGDISLDGMNITLKAGASLKLEGGAGLDLISDAITTIKGALVKIN